MSATTASTLSDLVTEILGLLRIADAKAEEDVAREPVVDAAGAALGLKGLFQKMKPDLAFVPAAQLGELNKLRLQFTNTYSGNPSEKTLVGIRDAYQALERAYAPAAALSARGTAVQDRLTKLAPTDNAGTVQIANATPAEFGALAGKRQALDTALANAGTVEAMGALAAGLTDLASERAKLDTLVGARERRRAEIIAAKAGFASPPETPTALAVQLGTLDGALATVPFSSDALRDAETALIVLTNAHAAAEKAVTPLRLQRAAFNRELDVLSTRVSTLAGSVATAKDKGRFDAVAGQIAACRLLLAVTATPEATASFPTEINGVHETIRVAMMSIPNTPGNVSGQAVTAYMRDEFAQIRQAVPQLPTPDVQCEQFQAAAKSQIASIGKLLGPSPTGGDITKARQQMTTLRDGVNAWRVKAGAAAIVLGQRSDTLKQLMAQPDPALADAAFKAALKPIRDQVTARLAILPPTEANVADAEAIALPFPSLLAAAAADAAAEQRVRTARSTLAGLPGVIAGAQRPAATVALTKADAAASVLEARTGMDRDRAQAAAALEALVGRMQTVAAEGDYASTDKAPFAGIAPGAQALAFKLCGPGMIGKLDAAKKAALGKALEDSGPAIEALMTGAFGNDPALFDEVLQTCGALGLAALADTFAGVDKTVARATLKGLLEEGGLGSDPKILSTLLADGVDKAANPAARRAATAGSLLSMTQYFAGDDGKTAMGTMMTTCGLGGGKDALPSLLLVGCGGDGETLRRFADEFTGNEPGKGKSRDDLARIMDAGMASHGKVLGPLVKLAGAGDPAAAAEAVKALGAAFVKPADCANLANLLDHGGMGGDTSTNATKHEYPDTLAKVFSTGLAIEDDPDGVAGNASRFQRYAAAFSGAAGARLSKTMLDATNEYSDTFAVDREPGATIATLLDEDHLNGDVEALRTKFMAKIDTIGPVDQQRKAIRFAPALRVPSTPTVPEGWKPVSPEMTAEGVVGVTASVLKRHKAEAFDRNKMGNAALHSQFPRGADVGALLDEAMTKITANRVTSQTVRVGNPAFTVEVGFYGGDKVNHFGPRGGVAPRLGAPPDPKETAVFATDEMNAILDGIS